MWSRCGQEGAISKVKRHRENGGGASNKTEWKNKGPAASETEDDGGGWTTGVFNRLLNAGCHCRVYIINTPSTLPGISKHCGLRTVSSKSGGECAP